MLRRATRSGGEAEHDRDDDSRAGQEHPRRRRNGLPASDSRTFMASARSRRRRLAILRPQRTGRRWARRVTDGTNTRFSVCATALVPECVTKVIEA